jgi:hypothetical protein
VPPSRDETLKNPEKLLTHGNRLERACGVPAPAQEERVVVPYSSVHGDTRARVVRLSQEETGKP